MGHIGVKGLGRAVEGLTYSDEMSETCEVCARANIKRTPFPHRSHTRATELLERIHSDVCGPLPKAYGNFQYFLTALDDSSSWGTVYLMKKRSETPQHIIQYKTSSERLHNTKLQILRVDNAPEYIEGELRKFCDNEGIRYERTVPEAPQQNGKAERHNYTYERMARAMLLDADLHDYFWPFAIMAAVYIKNRVPHAALPPDVTPFERWHGHKPDIRSMRPFGAHCMARIVNPKLGKLDPRGETGRFLGYASESKGYLFWHTASRTVKVRRDLVFHGPPLQPIGQGGVDFSVYAPLWHGQAHDIHVQLHDQIQDESQDQNKMYRAFPCYKEIQANYITPAHPWQMIQDQIVRDQAIIWT
jgi:hypothetical protein